MDLRAAALEQARAVLGNDGPLIPFVLVEHADGTLQSFTIVTNRSDRAFVLARRIVRSHAEGTAAYAIAVDTFVRIGGARSDAILLEVGRRNEPMAQVTAHPYANAAWRGDAQPFDERPSVLGDDDDPRAWSWGAVTPDLYNAKLNKVAHVVNHALVDAETVDRTIRFLAARAANFARHLPPSPPLSHVAMIEDRGRDIEFEERAALARGLANTFEIQWISELGN